MVAVLVQWWCLLLPCLSRGSWLPLASGALTPALPDSIGAQDGSRIRFSTLLRHNEKTLRYAYIKQITTEHTQCHTLTWDLQLLVITCNGSHIVCNLKQWIRKKARSLESELAYWLARCLFAQVVAVISDCTNQVDSLLLKCWAEAPSHSLDHVVHCLHAPYR